MLACIVLFSFVYGHSSDNGISLNNGNIDNV